MTAKPKYVTRKNTPQARQESQAVRYRRTLKRKDAPSLEDTARAIGLPLSKVSA